MMVQTNWGGKLLEQQRNSYGPETQYCDQDQQRQALLCMFTCIVIIFFLHAAKFPLIGTRGIDKKGSEILQRKNLKKIAKHYPDEVMNHFFFNYLLQEAMTFLIQYLPKIFFQLTDLYPSMSAFLSQITGRFFFGPTSELVWLSSLLTGLIHKIHQCT